MKNLFIAAALILGSWANASAAEIIPATWAERTVKFDYFSNRSFYACSYVESRAEKVLKALGATSVKVKCRGGLPWDNWVSADITFEALAADAQGVVNAQVDTVKLTVKEACDFHEDLIKTLLPSLAVTKVERKGFCNDSQGRLRYKIGVLQ